MSPIIARWAFLKEILALWAGSFHNRFARNEAAARPRLLLLNFVPVRPSSFANQGCLWCARVPPRPDHVRRSSGEYTACRVRDPFLANADRAADPRRQ
mgnify:CR=1 FL=1